jgi:hypothetical protein
MHAQGVKRALDGYIETQTKRKIELVGFAEDHGNKVQ